METKHDFEADNKFFVDNYGTLLNLYAGKTIIVADDRVLFVADDNESASSWCYKFGMRGKCSVLEVSPDSYIRQTEGVWI